MGAAKKPHCKYCGQPLQWRRTFKGELIPLNTRPVAGGAFVVRQNIALVVKKPIFGELQWEPHWATCSGAKQARAEALSKRQLALF